MLELFCSKNLLWVGNNWQKLLLAASLARLALVAVLATALLALGAAGGVRLGVEAQDLDGCRVARGGGLLDGDPPPAHRLGEIAFRDLDGGGRRSGLLGPRRTLTAPLLGRNRTHVVGAGPGRPLQPLVGGPHGPLPDPLEAPVALLNGGDEEFGALVAGGVASGAVEAAETDSGEHLLAQEAVLGRLPATAAGHSAEELTLLVQDERRPLRLAVPEIHEEADGTDEGRLRLAATCNLPLAGLTATPRNLDPRHLAIAPRGDLMDAQTHHLSFDERELDGPVTAGTVGTALVAAEKVALLVHADREPALDLAGGEGVPGGHDGLVLPTVGLAGRLGRGALGLTLLVHLPDEDDERFGGEDRVVATEFGRLLATASGAEPARDDAPQLLVEDRAPFVEDALAVARDGGALVALPRLGREDLGGLRGQRLLRRRHHVLHDRSFRSRHLSLLVHGLLLHYEKPDG